MSTNYINQIKDSNNTTQYLADGTDTRIFTGTCSSTGNRPIKEVVLDDPTNFSYSKGVKILITFEYGNTCDDDLISIEIQNVSPLKDLCIFVGGFEDLNGTCDYWVDNESVLFTYAPATSGYNERWLMTGCSGVIQYLIQRNIQDTRVRQNYIAPGSSSESGKVYPLLLCGASGTSSTSSRGSISANLNNNLRYTPYGDTLLVPNIDATSISDLFKVTTAAFSVGAIDAHSYISAAELSIPTASIPSGYNLVGIVGWNTSNQRIWAHRKHIVDNNTVTLGFMNTSGSNVTSSTTHTLYLLWAKAVVVLPE